MRRPLRMAEALGLCAAGSALALVSASQTWSREVIDHGPTLPLEHVARSGQQLAPGLRPLALLGLAGVLGFVASRGWGRSLIGCLLACSGLGIVLVELFGTRGHGTAWPYLAAGGGLMLMAGGVSAMIHARHWAGLSDAYRTPAARAEQAPATDKGIWDALDRGEDPTTDPHR